MLLPSTSRRYTGLLNNIGLVIVMWLAWHPAARDQPRFPARREKVCKERLNAC